MSCLNHISPVEYGSRRFLLRVARASACAGLLWSAAQCAPANQGDGPQSQQNLLGLVTIVLQNNGNCVQSTRQADNVALLSCSRTPPVNCARDRRIDATGSTIVTAVTESRYRTAWAALVETYPWCATASAAALVLPQFRASTDAEIKAKRETHFQIIADCDALGGTNGGQLISRQQHDFLLSPRGVLMAQSRALSDNFVSGGGTGVNTAMQCYQSLRRSAFEEDLLRNLSDGDSVSEKVCAYGALSGGTAPCSAGELSVAHPFDFDQPLQ